MILKGKTTSVKKHSSKSKRAKKSAKMEKAGKDNPGKDTQDQISKDITSKELKERTCPLCIVKLDIQDYDFYPCQCGYQVCGFCWHKIRTEGNSLCPHCRRTYTENPECYKPLSQETLQKLKKEQKQKELQKKKEQIESRKQLANIRVVQKNLVFVHGLPQGIDNDIEKYRKLQQTFKDFGPVIKCVVNNKTNYVGSQIPRASVYVTYQRIEDALKAYKSLPTKIEDYDVKTSLGTTKYCSNFLKNVHCPKQDCMYLHELADEELCFTKDQIHNSEHLEFGNQLYEKMVNHSSTRSPQANQPKDPVPSQNDQEIISKFNSFDIKDPVPTPTQSPRPLFNSDSVYPQSKFQQLFSSSSKDSINQVNGIDGLSTPNFSKPFEEHGCKFTSFAELSVIDAPSVEKSLLEENTVNTPSRPVLNSENFITPQSMNSIHKEMWPDQRYSVILPNNPNTVSNDFVQNRVNPTNQVLQGLTLNHEGLALNHEDASFYQKCQSPKRPDDELRSIYHNSQSPKRAEDELGLFLRKSQSPEIHDDDLGFDPVLISLNSLSNIVENSQPPQPTRRDLPWSIQMNEQHRAMQYKLNMQKMKTPPPGFPMNHMQQNQSLQSPVYNNPDTRNPVISRMSPLMNHSNNFMRTNYQRYPQGNMSLGGIPSMNGFPSHSHRNIAPQAIPIPTHAQAVQEMLARTVNNTQHIQSQSQNLSNHVPFPHIEQNLSPSLWNVNQASINQPHWMQMENSFSSQNIQDFRPASPSLPPSRRIPPQIRPDFPRQLTQQPLARFTNPPNFTDNPQYIFPNGQYNNQLTNGVPTFP